VVVTVPQPLSARAESAVVFLQKEIGGQQHVVRQYTNFEERAFDSLQQEIQVQLFSVYLISSGSVPVALKHLTPHSRIRSAGSRLRAHVGNVGVGSMFHDLRHVLLEYF
jgi:hypothetical protein